MSSNQGIFQPFNVQQPQPSTSGTPGRNSPFSVVEEQPSPFAIAPQQPTQPSPFSVFQEEARPASIPDRRSPQASPFQIAEPHSFGFEASPPQNPIPFSAPNNPPHTTAQPQSSAPAFQPTTAAWPQPAAMEQFPPAAPLAPAPPQQQYGGSESQSIKQLALRAIFGVDREMTKEEITQRARSLPGIRQIAIVNETDAAAFDGLKRVITNLGFSSAPLKVYSGSVPIEFIREGRVLLAVQTDGGFAPGVRETLLLIARELGN